MRPLVSVIVPTYNRASYLVQALDSAIAQDYGNIEIVVVDDGSTDDTPAVLQSYAGHVLSIRQANQGVSVARNTAIAASTGDYIALLDSDDIWLPGKLERQMAYLLSNPEVGMVGCHAVAIDQASTRLDVAPIFPDQNEGWVSLETILLRSPLPVDTLMIRREYLPAPLPFTPGVRFGEDWEMCLRVAARAPVWFMAMPLAAVRVHDHNVTTLLANQRDTDAKLQSRLGVIDRVMPLFQGDPVHIASLYRQAQALEYAEAAIPSYFNGAIDVAAYRLGQAVLLDAATWQGEKLVTLLSNFAARLYARQGQTAVFKFLNTVSTHLPPQIDAPSSLMRAVYARTFIFTIGFNSYRRHQHRSAAISIMRGLLQQPSYLCNLGVLLTLARSLVHSVLPTSSD